MHTRTYTRFRAVKQKYYRLQQRIQRLINTGDIHKFSRRKRQQLFNRLARYQRQCYRLVGATALAVMTTLPTQAQTFCEQTGANNPFNSLNISNAIGGYSTPHLVDLDGDGDLDLVSGEEEGTILYFENTGSTASPMYVARTGVDNPFNLIDVDLYSDPYLEDVDMDGDLDMIIGEYDGSINYHENTGDVNNPTFVKRTGLLNPFNAINTTGYRSTPQLVDLDGDGDLDVVTGQYSGAVNYFENTGADPNSPYEEQTGTNNPFDGISVGEYSNPVVADIDCDGDLDLIIGQYNTNVIYYENTGSTASPNYVRRMGGANPFSSISLVGSAPQFVDFDLDGDLDLVVGDYEGDISYYENCSTPAKVVLSPKVYLQGPLSGTSMSADLSTNSLVPPTEPYTGLGYSLTSGSGESASTVALANTGNLAIVDWVVVELRDANTPATIIESRAALLRADGTVVAKDGIGPVVFSAASGTDYHVAIRHRNHLSVMTGTAVQF